MAIMLSAIAVVNSYPAPEPHPMPSPYYGRYGGDPYYDEPPPRRRYRYRPNYYGSLDDVQMSFRETGKEGAYAHHKENDGVANYDGMDKTRWQSHEIGIASG